MKKLTFGEFRDAMFDFNRKNPNGKLTGVIVFTEDSYSRPYTETERSYRTDNSQKGFRDGMISNSIWADCLDGKDLGVRLDWYMYGDNGKDTWKVDYCYLEN